MIKNLIKTISYAFTIVFLLPFISSFFSSQEKESSIVRTVSADVPVPVEVPYVPYTPSEGGSPAVYYGDGGDGSCDGGDGGGGGGCDGY